MEDVLGLAAVSVLTGAIGLAVGASQREKVDVSDEEKLLSFPPRKIAVMLNKGDSVEEIEIEVPGYNPRKS